jgi:3-dehydroquinate dehydratase type I
MKLFVTIFEETFEASLRAIRGLTLDHDGVELRAEKFGEIDLQALRAATAKPIILTYRGSRVPDVQRALDAGIDFVDVEWPAEVEVPERTVCSHHDYEGMRDVETIMAAMRAKGCAYTKLAATPRNFAENERLLALLPGTVIGMGERGLYSRILAPFLGSELVFVANGNIAAPGQLTLERALEIYGRDPVRAEKVFAVVGNPAGHSLSPSIHNRLFREKGVRAAYTIASIESFDEITAAFQSGEPCGLSVTAPFKDDAFAFAERVNADIGINALRAKAVNTLVNLGDRILADNTDVDGFAALLPEAKKAAVVGAGGTGRAAAVALEDAGIPFVVYNRTLSKGDAPLDALASFDGDLVINTLPGGVDVQLPKTEHVIEAAYGGGKTGGLALLQIQAQRQHQLFLKVFDGL